MSKSEFHKIAQQVRPSRYIDYKAYLKDLYTQVKKHFGRYSYIKFTEELGLGHCNAMYLIIHGKRPLTVKAAKRSCKPLGLIGVERQYFLKLVEVSRLQIQRKEIGPLTLYYKLKQGLCLGKWTKISSSFMPSGITALS